MIRRQRATLLFLMCFGGSECVAAAAPQAAATDKLIVIPLGSLRTRHVTVSVRINDAGPFRLVFDTGSPITFVSGNAAQKAGLVSPANAQTPAMMGMRGESKVRTFRVGADKGRGGVTVRDFPVTILDHPLLGMLSQLEGPIDGIVGYSFFARFRTTIDYAAMQLTLVPVDYTPGDVMVDVLGKIMNSRPTQVMVAPAGLWGMIVEKTDEGVRLAGVFAKSAAEAAGLRAGDRIASLDGRWTETLADVYEAAELIRAGQTISVGVVRDGKELNLRVTPRIGF
jgi:membrane-associated protease RseP (regulator of RpoE activity)